MRIVEVDPRAPAVRALLRELDAYQLALYPKQFCYLDSAEELAAGDAFFVAAYMDDGDAPAGCGAMKYVRGDVFYGEVKRMFVAPESRGRGIAKAIMTALEADAVARGVDSIRLETGVRQPEAIGLYEAFGYRRREAFGGYACEENEWSVFMERGF